MHRTMYRRPMNFKPEWSGKQRAYTPEGVVDLLGGDDQRRQEAQRRRPRGVDDQALLQQCALGELGRAAVDLGTRPSARARARRAHQEVRAPPRAAARPARARRPGRPRRRSRRATASAADETTGPPANVDPWSPGAKTSRNRSPITSAPIGRPPPRPLASVIASGTTPTCSYAHSEPVRPMPVWTSSNTSAAPAASQADRIDASSAGSMMFTPDSPWTGSISTAAVEAPTAAGISSAGSAMNPGTNGANGACLASCGVALKRAVGAPVERVVGDDQVAARARLAHELDRGLVGLGARVAEEHELAERARGQPRRQLHVGRVVEEVGDVHEPRDLLLHDARPPPGGSGRGC